MKKVKDLTIKTKFPCISEERKNLIMLLKNSNINSKPLNKNEKNKIKPLKHFKSVDLLEALTPRYEHRKKPLSKIFSRKIQLKFMKVMFVRPFRKSTVRFLR